MFKRAVIGQETGGQYGIANTEGSGAEGVGQQMPATAKALAGRLGLPWRPDLMRGTDPQSRQYQDQITEAAAREAWDASGGDMRAAAMYYFGGPDPRMHGPKTRRYAENILARVNHG